MASDAPAAEAKVTIEPRSARTWDFAEDIVPDLHPAGLQYRARATARLDGQNGFHLSLFGYDPAGDYQAVARDGGQRRLSRLAPEESLFLGQGDRPGPARRRPSDGDRLAGISDPPGLGPRRGPRTSGQDARGRWRASGRAQGAVRLDEPGPRQLRVVAQYADGHLRDVTRLASFKRQRRRRPPRSPRRAASASSAGPRPI